MKEDSKYASGVTVAYAAPTRLVRVRIFGGMPGRRGRLTIYEVESR